nr:hypothetical protein [Tanacetum cinerariifolium]
MIKLTNFSVTCKAYGGEPSIDLLRASLKLGPAGNLLTLSNKGGSGIPRALIKPITHIEGWKSSFFFIKNKIVPSEYPKLLENNMLDKKFLKDVVPIHAREDPLYNQITTYPCNVRTFSDPILYLAGLKTSLKHKMDFKSFIVEEVDDEFHFLPDGGVNDEGISPSTKSVNNEALVIDAEPLTAAIGKKKQIIGSCGKERWQKVRRVPTQVSKAAGDTSDPLDVDSVSLIFMFLSAKELKESADCHWLLSLCTSFKEVAALKDPFSLVKILGYLSSSVKEFDQVVDDLATTSYPLIAEATASLCASLEELLSKKPKSLRIKSALSNTKPSSLKVPVS